MFLSELNTTDKMTIDQLLICCTDLFIAGFYPYNKVTVYLSVCVGMFVSKDLLILLPPISLGRVVVSSPKGLKTYPGPMRCYPVKESHIG